MNSSVIVKSSFFSTFDQQNREFKFGTICEVEKQAKQHGSMLLRQVKLSRGGFEQLKGNKQKLIPYPYEFNIITKNQFDQLPQNEKQFFPWTQKPNKNVRVFFDREEGGLRKTNPHQFKKPTAVYFDDEETGHRFMEFLKFKDNQRITKFKSAIKKSRDHWMKRLMNKVLIESNQKLYTASIRLADKKRQARENYVKQDEDIKKFDKLIYQQLFEQLINAAKIKEQKEKERIRQAKIQQLTNHQQFIRSIEINCLKNLVQIWNNCSQKALQEAEEREFEEQRRIQEEERIIQEQLENIEREEQEIKQEEERLSKIRSNIQQKQHKDLNFSNIKLIIDSHIKLLNPVLLILFKPLDSVNGKIEYIKGREFEFMKLDKKGWQVDLQFEISWFRLQDILEFIIYDDYQELNERIMARAQEEETPIQAFFATAKKMMQGKVMMLEFEKNLNNNKRHFVRLDVSAELQKDYFSAQLLNIPMIQLDLYEDSPFQITNSTINPYYLDIIELPITAQQLKYYLRQLKNPCNSLQQQWEQFKINALENALQMRGQIWANAKWSEDYIVEILEYLLEEGYNHQGQYGPLIQYLFHNDIHTQQNLIKTNLILASQRGFNQKLRNELLSHFLQFDQKLQKFSQELEIHWINGHNNILELVNNEVHKYLNYQDIQQNEIKVNNYINNIKFKYNTVWTEQYLKRLKEWKGKIIKIVNCCGVIDKAFDKLHLIIRLIQLFENKEDCDELVYRIIRCLNYQLLIPQIQCDKLNLQWFKPHLINLFSDFFYFDVWLRVFDYIIGIGYIFNNFDKAISSVIGGILNQMDFSQYRTQEEFIVGLQLYGSLMCDPEKLIRASYNSFLQDQFEPLYQQDSITQQLLSQGNPLEQILTDQKKLLQPQQQSVIIDVPDEHEGSMYDIQESMIVLPKTSQSFVFKQIPKRIFVLIHQLYLHQTTFIEQNKVIIAGQQKVESEGFYFEIPYQNHTIEIVINDQFNTQINLEYFIVNQIYKITQILQDKYEYERHYQISEIEFSILIQGEGKQSELLENNDHPIQYLDSQGLLYGVQWNAFCNPDSWKAGNNLNYLEFKQIMTQYFKLDPSQTNLQDLYQSLRQENSNTVYLIDILLKLTQDQEKIKEILQLFSPNETINHQQLRRLNLEHGNSRFLKVTICDENYEKQINLTEYFNSFLSENLAKYNSYDLLMIDENNYLYLLDKCGLQIQDFRSQMLILRIKYVSYGNIRKIQYQCNKQFKLANDLYVSATNIKDLLENNARILSLDCKTFMSNEKSLYQHLVYIRCHGGAKQYETCNVVGQILNKAKELQYFVVEVANKNIIVYKEDVLLFDEIDYQELQTFNKIWKQ